MLRPLCTVVVALLIAGCTAGGSGDPAPTGTATGAAPSPTPTPVRGEATVEVGSTDAGPIVFHDRPAAPADEAAIAAAVDRVTDWLDRHLTDLQSGGAGLIGEVARPGLLDGADPAVVAAVTADLASPARPVRVALYHVVVAHEGAPQWIRVTALVERGDGTVTRTGFVFTGLAADAPPALVAAGPDPAPGAASPPAATPAPEVSR